MNEELRLRTDEVNRATQLVDSMLAGLGIAVAVVDREMRVQLWNDGAKELWGVDSGEVRGQHFLNLDIGLPVQELRDWSESGGGSRRPRTEPRARERSGRQPTRKPAQHPGQAITTRRARSGRLACSARQLPGAGLARVCGSCSPRAALAGRNPLPRPHSRSRCSPSLTDQMR